MSAASALGNALWKPLAVGGADYGTVLRFKAMHLSRCPLVPAWIPRRGVEHASGSHGAVVFAFNPDTKKDVAIKMLDSDKKVHFFEELEALVVAAAHPCAVKILDVVSCETGRLGFVLERLGASLAKVMQESKKRTSEKGPRLCWPMTQGKFEEGFRGLWSALEFLAERRLAHSDIKPSNICFWQKDDEYHLHFYAPGRARLILCDFGATSLRMNFGSHPWSRTAIEKKDGVEITSKPYRAPELFLACTITVLPSMFGAWAW